MKEHKSSRKFGQISVKWLGGNPHMCLLSVQAQMVPQFTGWDCLIAGRGSANWFPDYINRSISAHYLQNGHQ